MNQPNLEKGQCVRIEWVDSAYLGDGWVYGNYEAKAKQIESVGFIVDFNDEAVAIAGTRSRTGGVVYPLTIPLVSIVKITPIEF